LTKRPWFDGRHWYTEAVTLLIEWPVLNPAMAPHTQGDEIGFVICNCAVLELVELD
jgi:hypothetical protein